MLSKNQNSLQCLKRPNLSLSYWTVAHLFFCSSTAIRASHHSHLWSSSQMLLAPVKPCLAILLKLYYVLLFALHFSCYLWTVSFICFIACLLPLRTSVAQGQGFLSPLFIVTSPVILNRAWHIPRPSVNFVGVNKWSFRTWNRVVE